MKKLLLGLLGLGTIVVILKWGRYRLPVKDDNYLDIDLDSDWDLVWEPVPKYCGVGA